MGRPEVRFINLLFMHSFSANMEVKAAYASLRKSSTPELDQGHSILARSQSYALPGARSAGSSAAQEINRSHIVRLIPSFQLL